MVDLYPHQIKAVSELHSGSILYGGVGTGKTFTGLAFYLKNYSYKDLIVITTAKKRNDGDWINEAAMMGITDLIVDSWNNIEEYSNVVGKFILFDEQRAIGNGKWSKQFIKIAKVNDWVMLTGTPGDKWEDYIPVFLANRFYTNKTEFGSMHLEYSRFTKFPQVIKYHNVDLLHRNRDRVLVMMNMERHTTRHIKHISVSGDKELYKRVTQDRWNVFEDKPIVNVSEFMSVLRRLVNTHESRIFAAKFLMDIHDKLIVFYNYNYELEILRNICTDIGREWTEYNGSKHEPIGEGDSWLYLVQYTAGAEGWNCITTDTILFFSLNYSYKIKEQSEGRIDRLNTPYTDLNYLYLVSTMKLDKDILKTVEDKKRFNTSAWLKKGRILF